MKSPEKLQLVRSIMEAAWGELRRLGEDYSCIYTSSVLTEVFKAKGFNDAYPLTVRARILNPDFVERLKTEPFPSDDGTLEKWLKEGCAIVAVGEKGDSSTENRWDGHLVVVLPEFFGERAGLCDLSIMQADKPKWGITLGLVFANVPNSFVAGEAEFNAPAKGSKIVYHAFPEDRSYESAPVWKNKAYRDVAVKNILTNV